MQLFGGQLMICLFRKDIYKIMLSQKEIDSSAVHFGPLIIQPKTKCLNYNTKYEKGGFSVQIKWHDLYDDIRNFNILQVIT